jgi:hypothetical protein
MLDLEGDASHSVDDVLHPVEVGDDVVAYGELSKVLEGLHGQVRAAGGERGVYLVLTYAGDLYERIPQHRTHPAAGLRNYDGVRARNPVSRRVAPEQHDPIDQVALLRGQFVQGFRAFPARDSSRASFSSPSTLSRRLCRTRSSSSAVLLVDSNSASSGTWPMRQGGWHV